MAASLDGEDDEALGTEWGSLSLDRNVAVALRLQQITKRIGCVQ